MKALLILLLLVSSNLLLSAGQIQPPSYLIKKWARIMQSDRESKVLKNVDYKKIAKNSPEWTEKEVKRLFKSIDLGKVHFEEHRVTDKTITMIEPIRVKFTFEARHRAAPPEIKHAVTTFYWLVDIDRMEAK